MGRPLRIHLPGLIHHIFNRGNNRQSVFLEDGDYYHFLSVLKRYKDKYGFRIFAYCIMPNHIHLLIRLSDTGTVSEIMKAMTIAHTRHYHLKYGTVGHVWQGRFKSPIVSTDNHLLTLMRYIEQNPVRAGMVDHPGKYPFSSYHANTSLEINDLVDKEDNPTFIAMGRAPAERAMQYKRGVAAPVRGELVDLIRKTLGGRGHFSSEEYLSTVLKSPRTDIKRRPGRPKTK